MTLNTKKRILTSLLLLIILVLIFVSSFALIFFLILVGIFSILEMLSLIQKIKIKQKVLKLLFAILFVAYIFFYETFFFIFLQFPEFKFAIFYALIACIFSDVGGFVVGRALKGPKLISLSPNKTISGSFGSFFFSACFASLIFFIFPDLNFYSLLIYSLIVSLGCQVGDIFFSFIKRKANVKDTGNILPGHGGILDRIDGILLGVPLGIIFLIMFFK